MEAPNNPADAAMIVIKLPQPKVIAPVQVQSRFKARTRRFQPEKPTIRSSDFFCCA
jgi:hypothetical protein